MVTLSQGSIGEALPASLVIQGLSSLQGNLQCWIHIHEHVAAPEQILVHI